MLETLTSYILIVTQQKLLRFSSKTPTDLKKPVRFHHFTLCDELIYDGWTPEGGHLSCRVSGLNILITFRWFAAHLQYKVEKRISCTHKYNPSVIPAVFIYLFDFFIWLCFTVGWSRSTQETPGNKPAVERKNTICNKSATRRRPRRRSRHQVSYAMPVSLFPISLFSL